MNLVKDISLTNKAVFLRCDLNVPMKDGKIIDNSRILASIATIKYLISVGAKIIICSHLGRPDGKFNEKYSLLPIKNDLVDLSDRIFVRRNRIVGVVVVRSHEVFFYV